MNKIKGIPASQGIAKGFVHIEKLEKMDDFEEKKISNNEEEIERLEKAIIEAKNEIRELKEKTKEEMGAKEADIFQAHLMFLDDPEFIGSIKNNIEEKNLSAESSLTKTMKKYAAMFENMDNEYMRARKTDIEDVSRRVFNKLTGVKGGNDEFAANTVVIGRDLTPSMTASFNKEKIAAFVTAIGSRTSHTAIMSRSLGIPSVVGIGEKALEDINEGEEIIVDGNSGEVIVEADKKTSEKYENKIAEYEKELSLLEKYKDKKAVTADGKEVEVSGNIGNTDDIDLVLENGGEGIGLFRTEFLYMNREKLPGEEEQFEAYKKAAEMMEDRAVIIRTLDIGGDKELPYLDLDEEMNPFLGYRAIRLCLDHKDKIFKPQLKAILRASHYGNIKMMYPLISSYEELIKANEILDEVKDELDAKNIKYDTEMEVGIMIETPAAVMIADKLAKEVDFFSIGTNDLIQYTVAVDRTNEKISSLHNPYHPGVLRLIKRAIDAAHNENIWIGMCGAAAGNKLLLAFLLGAGLDEFSMSAASIPEIKAELEKWTKEDAKKIVSEVTELNTSKEIEEYLKKVSR